MLHQLSVYQDRIYFGYGDVGENDGPLEMGCYDPARHRFVSEFLFGTEAIGRMRVINGDLHVPAIDPAHFFNQADYARRTSDGLWRRNARLGMLHAYDVAWFQGQLIVVGSSRDVRNGRGANTLVWSSPDHGLRWEAIFRTEEDPTGLGRFVYSVPFEDRLYVGAKVFDGSECLVIDNEEETLGARVRHHERFGDEVVYTTGTPNEFSEDKIPMLMAFDGRSRSLGEAIDFCLRGEELVVLRPGPRLEATTNLSDWQPLAAMDLPADARSLAAVGNDLYVGTQAGCLWRSAVEDAHGPPEIVRRWGDSFGRVVAAHGVDVVAVAAPAAGRSPWNHGQVLVETGGAEPQILRSPSPSALGYFGAMLAVHGEWMAVGEARRGDERVQLYQREGDSWEWRQTLHTETAPVSLALDERHLVIGSQAEARRLSDLVMSIYQRDGESWQRTVEIPIGHFQEELDGDSTFQGAVALHGDLIALGITGDPSDNKGQGLVVLYEKEAQNDDWERSRLLPEVEPESSFGAALALNERWLVVGAPRRHGEGFHQGVAYVFDRSASDPFEGHERVLEPPPGDGGYFGQALALKGALLVVGAPEVDWLERASGAAYVYDLESEELPRGIDPVLPGTRGFGCSVALNEDRITIGAETVPSVAGTPRGYHTIIDVSVDGDLDRLADDWEAQHFGGGDADPEEDSDDDGQTNLQEFLAGTDPNEATSRLWITEIRRRSEELEITWQAVPGRRYAVLSGEDLTNVSWQTVESMAAASPAASLTVPLDTRARFYRVALVMP